MKHRIGTPAECHHSDHRVLEGSACHDVARFDVCLHQLQDRSGCTSALIFFVGIFCRNTRRIRQRHTESLDRCRHRVGRVHASTGSRTWATCLHDLLTFFVADLAGNELTITLKRTDDVQLFAVPESWLDRSAVDHDRGTVQAAHRDQTARHILVAARQGNQRVIPLCAHDRFDRIGNQVAALQAKTHAIGTHRNTVADANGVETHPHHPSFGHGRFHIPGQIQQVHVATVAFVPNAADANLGLVHVFSAHSCCVQHRLRSTLTFRLRDFAGVFV